MSNAPLCAFEAEVKLLNLKQDEYVSSVALRKWVASNKGGKYVPVWLIKAYGLSEPSDTE